MNARHHVAVKVAGLDVVVVDVVSPVAPRGARNLDRGNRKLGLGLRPTKRVGFVVGFAPCGGTENARGKRGGGGGMARV